MVSQEVKLKKYKAKLKGMNDPVANGGARGSSYNRNPNHNQHHTGPNGERQSSKQKTRSNHQRQESSGEKQVLAAHQITFN